jgi:DNA replication protein DnaC
MLTEPTVEKLRALRLDAMAQMLAEQQTDPDVGGLGFEERLGLMVDAEWTHQQNKRLQRRLREAKLKLGNACVEDLEFSPRRGLDRGVIRQLAGCRWIEEHENIALTGPTGVGKTFLACALAHQACRKGHRAMYRRMSRLFEELTLARAEGSYGKALAKFARVHVLVIEDFGLTPVTERDRYDLLEILEDRYAVRSTIMTSQLPTNRWHDQLGDPTVADAILDRVLHNAHKIVMKGPSRRKRPEKKEG